MVGVIEHRRTVIIIATTVLGTTVLEFGNQITVPRNTRGRLIRMHGALDTSNAAVHRTLMLLVQGIKATFQSGAIESQRAIWAARLAGAAAAIRDLQIEVQFGEDNDAGNTRINRGTEIVSKGRNSNEEAGWQFLAVGSAASTTLNGILIIEWSMEWLGTSPRNPAMTDTTEEENNQ